MKRSLALTMPLVTVCSRPNGLPMAITGSPTSRRSESPNGSAGRLLPSIFSSATSVRGSSPTTFALYSRWSPSRRRPPAPRSGAAPPTGASRRSALTGLDDALHLLAEFLQPCTAEFLLAHREHLFLFLVGVVLHQLGEDRHLRDEPFVLGIDLRQLGEDEVDDVMLLERLIDHLLGLLGADLAHGRVEDLFLDLGVELQLVGNLVHQLTALAAVLGLVHLLEERLHALVLFLE